MSMNELKQRMNLYISTMQNLTGCKPSLSELHRALGTEYKEIISEYLNSDNMLAGVA